MPLHCWLAEMLFYQFHNGVLSLDHQSWGKHGKNLKDTLHVATDSLSIVNAESVRC